jgi:hypothetical protein
MGIMQKTPCDIRIKALLPLRGLGKDEAVLAKVEAVH